MPDIMAALRQSTTARSRPCRGAMAATCRGMTRPSASGCWAQHLDQSHGAASRRLPEIRAQVQVMWDWLGLAPG